MVAIAHLRSVAASIIWRERHPLPAPGAPGFERRRDRLPRNVSGTEVRPDRATASTSTVTVRDATFDVLRRRGMTKIFSNPGSTEVPFLVDLPSDLEFVLALPRARGRDRDRVGARPGRARLRPAAHDAGLEHAVSALATAPREPRALSPAVGQQDRRHSRTSPSSGQARGSPRRVSRLGRPADPSPGRPGLARAGVARGADATRAGARDRADGRLAGAGARAVRARRSRSSRPCGSRGRRCGGGARAAARAGGVPGPRRRRRSRRSRDVGRARRARRAPGRSGLAGALRRAGGLPAGAPALRGRSLGRPRQAPRGALRPRRRSRRRRARLSAVRLCRRPVRGGRNGGRRRHRGPRRGAPQPGTARRAGATSVRLCRARRAPPAARGRAAALHAGSRAAGAG